jgi:hypothetical protein
MQPMKHAKTLCLAVLTASASFLLIEGGLLLWRAQSSLSSLTADIHNTATDYQRLAQEAVGTMAPLRATLKASKDSSDAIAKNSAQATLTLNTDLIKVGTLLDKGNNTLGDLDFAVTQMSENMTSDVNQTVVSLRPAIQNLVSASAGAADAMNDPAIKATLANMQSASGQVVGIAEDAHTESSLVVAQTRQAFKPKNKFLAVLQMLGGGAVTAAEGFYYFTH